MTVYSVLTSILPVIALTLLQCAIHARKQDKAKLALLVPVAFIYSIAAVFAIWKYHIRIEEILEEYEYKNYTVIVVNMLLMAGFLVVKLIIGGILKRRAGKDLITFTSSRFYHYTEEYDRWFLKNNWVNYRTFQNVIRWGMAIAAGFFLSFIRSRTGEEVITLTFPCSVVIISNEIYHFINGQTREEFEHSILGTEAESRRAGFYFRIREILEQLLPDPLLSAITGFELAGRSTPLDMVKKLSKSEDKFDKITGEYYLTDNRFMRAETDGVRATLDLMHRKNVLMHNPFYRDLDMYITLPLVHALISGRKVVVVTGRMSAKADVHAWLSELLAEYTHMPSLWHVEDIGEHKTEGEIGILGFPELYNSTVLANNEEFFREVDLVILVEPSAILSTGQIAFSILTQTMERGEKKPVIFACDRMTDGLVDTLSHLFRAEFTEVVASPVPRCIYTGMTWNANGDYCRQQLFDKQTNYLGNGIELAAIALKNQIPKVTWYGETKVPIRDIKWLTGQNYPVICQYINQPSQQSTIYEKIDFVANLWSAPTSEEQFSIVEDEFNNMFATMKTYLTRGRSQSFVNVMSENYLLRDYMRCNQQMFIANPNAVPSIVPDYAKTERNTLIKLILLMNRRKVDENEILDEFHLVGCDGETPYALLNRNLRKYTTATGDVLDIDTIEVEADELTTSEINVYSITNDTFRKYFERTLAEAYYIVEDEIGMSDFVDARFFSHVTQTVLPGQFVTYDGKYYRVQHISPQSGVVLRRASDLFDDRRYYRQLRTYTLTNSANILISSRKVADIEFSFIQRDISVSTSGYLDMPDVHDLRAAKTVDLSGDPLVDNYTREFKNKTILRVKLPETDEDMRFTFCMLLSETLRSVFPDGWPFIAVTTSYSEDIHGVLNTLVYPVRGDVEEDYIYIIEDSDVDLGLTGAIERNWDKLMEIIADFLSWHFEKMREPAAKDPVQPSYEYSKEQAEAKKPSWFAKMAKRIRQILGGGKEEKIVIDDPDSKPEPEAEAKPEPEAGAQTEPKPEPETGAETETEAKPEPETGTETEAKPEPEAEAKPEPETGTETEAKPEPAPASAPAPTTSAPAGQQKEGVFQRIKNLFPQSGDGRKYISDMDFSAFMNSEESSKLTPADIDDLASDMAVSSTGIEAMGMDIPSDVEHPDHELEEDDGTDIFDESGDSEDDLLFELEFRAQGLMPLPMTRYRRECFLKFGFDEIDKRLKLDELMKYMRVHGWTNNTLTQARKREPFARTYLDVKEVNHCDFCGRPLSGASYEVMNDGRVRCNDCSASAITTLEEFRELFFQSLELMEAFYGIKFRVPITVQTADARTVAKGAGSVFRPSTEYAARVLGFAQKKKDKYSLIIENGSPRLAATETMVHEMTHIWQYINWKDNAVDLAYNMGDPVLTRIANDMVYEGMAVWASIQYLYMIGESQFASELEWQSEQRRDVYGLGFLLYREQYPLIKDGSLIKITPYASFPPIDPVRVREVIMALISK